MEEDIMSIDEILRRIGFGRYQIWLQVLLNVAICSTAMQVFVLHFLSLPLTWECKQNSTFCNITGIVTSKSDLYSKRCAIPRTEWNYLQPKSYSIGNEFNLDCGGEKYLHLLTTLYFIFGFFGGICLGWASDRYGRFKVFYASFTIPTIVALISAFSPNYWFFAVTRCIIGFLGAGTASTAFIIASELSSPRFRPIMGVTLYIVSFPVAMALLAGQAYAVQNWRHLLLLASAPYVLMFALAWFVPESVRWLRQNEDKKKLMKSLRRMAKMNHVHLPDNFQVQPIPKDHDQSRPSPIYLVNTRKMLYRTLVLCFASFTVSSSYFGLTYATDNLSGDVYRDFILSGLMEIPAGILGIVTCMKFGRKYPVVISFVIGGLCCVLIPSSSYMGSEHIVVWVRVAFGLCGKLFITLAYDIVFVWSVELFPTIIRSEALAVLATSVAFGSAASPWISKWLLVFHEALPFALMGVNAVLSGCLLNFLPETENMSTLEDLSDIKVSTTESNIGGASGKPLLLSERA